MRTVNRRGFRRSPAWVSLSPPFACHVGCFLNPLPERRKFCVERGHPTVLLMYLRATRILCFNAPARTSEKHLSPGRFLLSPGEWAGILFAPLTNHKKKKNETLLTSCRANLHTRIHPLLLRSATRPAPTAVTIPARGSVASFSASV